MATITALGPTDHGRKLSWEEFRSTPWQEGYRYELIDGRLYVSPAPNLPHDRLVQWLFLRLVQYADAHPEVFNYVTQNGRVFVPERPEATEAEPDITCYQHFPLDQPLSEGNWRELSPVLVVEVVSEDTAEKDTERNVELYLQVPSVREYWIVDPRPDPDRPTLIVYRRRGQRWQKPIVVRAGGTYETPRLLPGFALTVAPRP